MRRTPWRAISVVVILGLAVLSCDGPNRGSGTQPSAASGFRVIVTASPNVIRGATAGTAEAQGGCTQIVVTVFDTAGRLVDGAEVDVTTTLGRFVSGTGEFVALVSITVRGSVSETLCAKSERGTAIVTAVVEGAVGTTLVTIF